MQLQDFVLPVLYIVFLWWFTTGLIFATYGRSQRLTHLVFQIMTVCLFLAFGGLFAVRGSDSRTDVYVAVTCGVVIWGWQVASYYLGYVTGPLKATYIAPGKSLWERFTLAIQFLLFHELLAFITAVILFQITSGYPNRWGLWMYLALWLMHTSAKLNVFLGVRNFRIEILPRQLRHLDSLLTRQSFNLLFPFSITLATSAVIWLLYTSIAPEAILSHATGAILIATMIALGLLEHWLLVLPVSAIFWGWGFRPLPEKALPGTGD